MDIEPPSTSEREQQQQPQQQQQQQQKVFTCPHQDCNKSYGRVEHLVRHSVSHIHHKPYRCELCSKGFARKDVLVRHQRSHSASQSIPRTSERRTSALQKVKQACLGCKSAKSRCDGNSPCAHCISAKKECIYPAGREEAPSRQNSSSRSTSAALEAALQQDSRQHEDVDAMDQDDLDISTTVSQTNGLLTSARGEGNAISHHGSSDQGVHLLSVPSNLPSSNDRSIDSSSSSKTLLGFDSSSKDFSHGNTGMENQATLATHPSSSQTLFTGLDFNGLLFGQPLQALSPASHLTSEPSAYTFDFNNWITDGDDYLSSFIRSVQDPSPSAAVPQSTLMPSSIVWPEMPSQSTSRPHIEHSNVAQQQTFSSPEPNLAQLLRNDGRTSSARPGGQEQRRFGSATLSNQNAAPSANSATSLTDSVEHAAHITDALLSLTAPVVLAEESNSPGSRPVPPLNHGLRTRVSSPTLPIPTANTEWPTAWEPSKIDDYQSGDIDVGEVHTHQRDTNIHSIEEVGRLAIMELLRFAEFKVETYHRLYVRFARISVRTLDHFLGLYFKHIHPYIPWCHLATFEPSKISGFLLASMIALGAQYSDVGGAKQFSHVLGDIVQRAVGEVVTKDNTLNRELQLWQALMLWSFFKGAGVRRLTELTDVFRNSYTVAFDRMYIFGNRNPLPADVLNSDIPLQRRWQLWKTWEGRKRTGFACFLADAEFTVFLNRPNLVVPRELKASLPCSDIIWEAATAHEWETATLSQPDFGASKPSACDILDFRAQAKPLLAKARHSAFASSVLIQLLHLSIWSLRQSGVFSAQLLKTAHLDLKRALVGVGGGANEFVVGQDLNQSQGWTSFAILYHQAFLSLRIAPATLLALAGKDTPEEAEYSRQEILRGMQANPTSLREVALHAGQCLRIIRESNHGSPVEVFSLFSATLVLYVFCLAIQEKIFGPVEADQSNDVISLDTPSPSAVEVGWSQSESLSCSIADFELSTKSAKIDVLLHGVAIYRKMKGWGLGLGFSRILQNMADRERLFDATLASQTYNCA